MKNILVCILFMFFNYSLKAQTVLNFGDYDDAYGISAFQTSEYIIHFGFDNQTTDRRKDLIASKVDEAGNIIQTVYFGSDSLEFINYVVFEDNYFYVTGTLKTFGESRGFVIKLNQSLQQLWYKSIGGEGESVLLNSIDVENDLLYAGGANFSGNLQFYSVLLDTSGQIIWTKTTGNPFPENINSVYLKNNVCYATGDRADISNKINPVLIRYDYQGNMLQMDDFNLQFNSGSRSIRVNNQNIYIIGETAHERSPQFDVMVYRFSLTGNLIQSTHFGEVQESDAGFDLLLDDDLLRITGHAFDPNFNHKAIGYFILNEDLQLLASNFYHVNHMQIGNRISRNDNQIIISGQSLDADKKFIVVREIPLKSNFMESNQVTYSVKNLEDKWQIDFSTSINKVELYNFSGIKTEEIVRNDNTNRIEIKKPDHSGLYILKVWINEKVYSVKLVF